MSVKYFVEKWQSEHYLQLSFTYFVKTFSIFLCMIPALQNMLSVTLPKYIEIVQKDSTHTTVLAVLETIKEMLEKIKAPMLAENGFLDSLCTTVKMVFQNKVSLDTCAISVE